MMIHMGGIACGQASEVRGAATMQAVYVHPLMAARDFGRWLEGRMTDVGITQAELARVSGVNEGSLSRYRRGLTTPDPDTIRRIAVHLEADVDQMLRLAGHIEGEQDEDGRMLVIRTEDPKVLQLVRLAEGQDPEAVEQALEVLRVLFPRRKK